MVTAVVAPSSVLPCANSAIPRGLFRYHGSLRRASLCVKPRLLHLRGLKYNCGEDRGSRGRRRGGCCVAVISETENEVPALEEQESEAREDERTGMEGYKLKENSSTQPVHLEMETVNDVVRPKRITFDYGFQAKFLRTGPSVPGNVVKLAFENFGREWRSLRRTVLFTDLKRIDSSKLNGPLEFVLAYTGRGLLLTLRGLDKFLTLSNGLGELQPLEPDGENLEQDELRAALKKLKLSNKAVWQREHDRPQVEAPWWIMGPYQLLCLMLDVIFEGRPIQRFWFLETVARMPYFSYISMLHLYETLGWWRIGAEIRKVHFAEEWNEMHHLKIMESLGGDLEWGDRFFAQHAAFFYYWVLNIMFLISPKVAYNFSELVEAHAVDTYAEFAEANEELLKTLPPSPVAVSYYESEDLYMYDEFQTSQAPESRRPTINSLYDVFAAITGDEMEHVKTMAACQQLKMSVMSPHDRIQMEKEKAAKH